MNNTAHISDNERLIALIGLATTKHDSHSISCPSDAQLAELIDNTLDIKQRNTVLRHLNRCNECYQLWLETSTLLLEEKDLIEVVDLEQYRATAS